MDSEVGNTLVISIDTPHITAADNFERATAIINQADQNVGRRARCLQLGDASGHSEGTKAGVSGRLRCRSGIRGNNSPMSIC